MFDEPAFRWLFGAAILLAVALLFWWQDFDGIRSSWEYHRRCRKRERLTVEEFYHRFYEESGIPAELVRGLRQFHATYWGEDPELLRPEDDLFQISSGADCAGWVAEVRALFGVDIPEKFPPELRSALPGIDQSFDCVLRAIYLLQGTASQALPDWRCGPP